MKTIFNNKRGFIGVVTVLIVAAITLTIAITIALLGTNELLLGFESDQSQEVLQYADGCAEEGYYRLKRNSAYTGGTIPYTAVNCTISVSGAGANRTITASVTSNDFTRTVDSDVVLQSNTSGDADGVDLTDWDEN